MSLPLDFWSISLWLAITSLTLLGACEMLSQEYGKVNIRVDRKRLRQVALASWTLFMATVAIRIGTIILDV